MSKVMKASEFVKKAKDIANNYKTLYVLGCFGAPMNATNKKRYTTNNDYNKQPVRTKMIMNATDDTFGFDCVCLLKGIFWGWNGNKKKTYGGATYCSNGVPDVGADLMFSKYCENKSNNFKNIEVGEFVWMSGHIGVYIGDGLAVECTPAWKNKVQITAVGNIGKKDGYSTRKWTSHGKSVFLEYDVKEENKPKQETLVQLAKKVINGDFGNGLVRKTKLALYIKKNKLPYTVKEVQNKVNELLRK